MQDSPQPVRVSLIEPTGPIPLASFQHRLPGGSTHLGPVKFVEPGEQSDVSIVFGYLKYDTKITARAGGIWNWHLEPIVRRPFGRGYDRIFTHLDVPEDPRVSTAAPVLDWWLGKSYDELVSLPLPEKSRPFSAIASTKDWIDGHRLRGEIVTRAAERFPDMDLFGRGREREVEDKWDGLAPYRYSLAIENTAKRDYWTEKIADCFLSYTVPFYWGATNISDYFPEQSFVWLPIDDPPRALEIIQNTLDRDDWESRLPALKEARRRVLDRYSLAARVLDLVERDFNNLVSAPLLTKKVHGRRTRPGGWIRGIGLSGNLHARLDRRRQRQSRPAAGKTSGS